MFIECSQKTADKYVRMHPFNRLPILLVVLCFSPANIPAADGPARSVYFEDAVAAAIVHPAPEYNNVATQLKLSGLVEIAAFVDLDGTVYDTIIVTGNPVLTRLACDAVKQWKFKPFLDDRGNRVKVMAYLKFEMEPPKKRSR